MHRVWTGLPLVVLALSGCGADAVELPGRLAANAERRFANPENRTDALPVATAPLQRDARPAADLARHPAGTETPRTPPSAPRHTDIHPYLAHAPQSDTMTEADLAAWMALAAMARAYDPAAWSAAASGWNGFPAQGGYATWGASPYVGHGWENGMLGYTWGDGGAATGGYGWETGGDVYRSDLTGIGTGSAGGASYVIGDGFSVLVD